MLNSCLFEVRVALRSLTAKWLSSLFLVLTLVLGIGFSGGSFLLYRELVLDPLPYPDADELVLILRSGSLGRLGLTLKQIADLSQSNLLQGIGGYRSDSATFGSGAEPFRVLVGRATPSLLRTLRIRPLIGRIFQPDEADAALISEPFWKKAFASDPSIIGKVVTLNGKGFEIVGVVPSESALEDREFHVWTPLLEGQHRLDSVGFQFLSTIGRLRPGISPVRAKEELAAIVGTGPGGRLDLVLTPLAEVVVGETGNVADLLVVGSLGILAGACVLVTLFLLVHLSSGRQLHAMVVRQALGATRADLAARIGGLVGGLVAPAALLGALSVAVIRSILFRWKTEVVQFHEVRLDGWLGLALALLTLACVTACFAPIYLYLTKADLNGAVSRSGRLAAPSGWRLHRLLLGAVVALALTLSIGAAVAFAAVVRSQSVSLGFEPADCYVAVMPAPGEKDLGAERHFWLQLIENLKPAGLDSVGVTSKVPSLGGRQSVSLPLESGREAFLDVVTASPGLFPALGIRMLRGRSFTEADNESNPRVAIVNEKAARILYGSAEAALGKVLRYPAPARIVGVSEDHLNRVMLAKVDPVLWFPYLQYSTPGNKLVVRGQFSLPKLKKLLREKVDLLDPSRSIEVISMESVLAGPLRRPRAAAYFLSLFATMLVLYFLGVVGGNVALVLKRQSRNTAIRIALGATLGSVARRQVRSLFLPLLCGLGSGVLATVWLMRVLSALLPNIAGADLGLGAGVSAAVLALGLCLAAVIALRQVRSTDILSELNDS